MPTTANNDTVGDVSSDYALVMTSPDKWLKKQERSRIARRDDHKAGGTGSRASTVCDASTSPPTWTAGFDLVTSSLLYIQAYSEWNDNWWFRL